MAEYFQNKQRTLNERVRPDEGIIVPNELALQGRNSDNKTDDCEQEATEPIFVQISPQLRRLGTCHVIVAKGANSPQFAAGPRL